MVLLCDNQLKFVQKIEDELMLKMIILVLMWNSIIGYNKLKYVKDYGLKMKTICTKLQVIASSWDWMPFLRTMAFSFHFIFMHFIFKQRFSQHYCKYLESVKSHTLDRIQKVENEW